MAGVGKLSLSVSVQTPVTVERTVYLSGLAAYWRLEEDVGTRRDSFGANHLTDVNTVTQAAGKLGNAAQFTRANSEYLSITDNTSISVGDIDFTIGCWVYIDALPANGEYPGLFGKWAFGQRSFYLIVNGDNDLFEFGVSADGTAAVLVRATDFGVVSTATWYWVCAWHDAAADTINISVNNGTTTSAAHATGVNDGTSDLLIGGFTTAQTLDGREDAAFLTKQVLTAAQRTAIYNGGAGMEISGTAPNIAGVGSLTATLDVNPLEPKLYGVGTLGAAFATTIPVTANLTGTGTLAASFQTDIRITANLPGVGTLAATLETVTSITAALPGVGTLAATLVPHIPVSATTFGVGTLAATFDTLLSTSANITGVGTLAATFSGQTPVAANLTGVGTLAAAFEGVTPVSAALPGVGTLAVTLETVTTITAAVTGVGTLAGVLVPHIPITANTTGIGTLTANVEIVSIVGDLAVSAALTGIGTLSATLQADTPVTAALPGVGTLAITAETNVPITAALTGAGALTASVETPVPPADSTPTQGFTGLWPLYYGTKRRRQVIRLPRTTLTVNVLTSLKEPMLITGPGPLHQVLRPKVELSEPEHLMDVIGQVRMLVNTNLEWWDHEVSVRMTAGEAGFVDAVREETENMLLAVL